MRKLMTLILFASILIVVVTIICSNSDNISFITTSKTSKEISVSINAPVAKTDEYKHLRYDLITTVVYAKMYINADGSLTPCDRYDPVPTIRYAHSKGVRVILKFMVANDDSRSIDSILGNSMSMSNAIGNLLNETINKGFDGTLNNFEGINEINIVTNRTNRDLMTVFQKQLAQTFWAKNSNYVMNANIPYYNWNNVWDIANLKNYVNYFNIMAYGFGRGDILTRSGSWAPMNDSSLLTPIPQGIVPMIRYWQGQGLTNDRTLLGIAYEGTEWRTVDNNRLSNIIGQGNWIYYDSFVNNVLQYQRIWDDEWQTPRYIRQIDGIWYQAFIDDEQSLGIKYDLVNSQGIAGITIWSIDEGTDITKLWQLIQDKFSTIHRTYK